MTHIMNRGQTINYPQEITYTHDKSGSDQGYINFSVLTLVIEKLNVRF